MVKKDNFCFECGKIFKKSELLQVGNKKYCKRCAEKILNKQAESVNVNIKSAPIVYTKPAIVVRKWSTSLLISIFLGWLGLDRFYFNQNILGILKFITFGGFGFWWFIDIILIASRNVGAEVKLVDNLEDK